MASTFASEAGERQNVMALFKAGRSKSEIGREIGKDKKAVGKILAQAIKEASNHA